MHRGLRALPIGIVAIYVAIVLGLCDPARRAFGTLLFSYLTSTIPVWLIVGLCALIVTMARRQLKGIPGSAREIVQDFIRSRWQEDRLVSVFAPLFCFVLLMTAYNIFKTLYLPSVGFWAGRYIAHSERVLLNGNDAWQITHWIFSSPWATQAMDMLYHAWFLPMVVGVAICSYARSDSRLAWRYLTSYLLAWSAQGSLLAYVIPAAGPAMHGSMHSGSTKFAALNVALEAQNAFLRAHGAPGLYAIEYQRGLVALFNQSIVTIGGGISAMPSLHNAMAVLFACAAWSIGRRAGIVATLYAILIWLGSVHLGWHYALDGVVAAMLTALCWVGVGHIPALCARRLEQPPFRYPCLVPGPVKGMAQPPS